MKKFTFIAEFKNGTYISQYKADNLMEAVLIWADNLDVQFFTNKVKTKIQEKVTKKIALKPYETLVYCNL